MKNKTSFLLFLVALLVRLFYAWWGRWWGGDSAAYLAIAKNIAFNHAFNQLTGIPTAWRPPLYPFLIAAFWWSDNAPITAVILVQVVCGAATVVLVYLIARDSFNRRVALIAALAATFAPMTVHYTAVILTETLFTFLLVLGVYFWGRNRALAAGLAFGFAALTRTTIIPFLACLPILAFLPPWRNSRRLYLLIFLTAMGIASVWIARNAVVFREFILVQSGGFGVNLFAGTIESPMYGDDVWSNALKELNTDREYVKNERDRDRRYLRQAIDRIESDPGHYLKVRLKQYPRLFLDSGDYLLGSRNVIFSEALREGQALVVITKVSFMLGNILVIVLAIYGMFLERRRFIALGHIVLFPIFLSLIHLPMWIEGRYSLPMMPLVLILAARGVEEFVSKSRVRAHQ